MIADTKPAIFGQVEARIAAILGDAAHVEELRTVAYKHPNGFAKLPILNQSDGSILRIHRWQKGLVVDPNVHSHRWDMRSLILEGAYRARDYVEAADGEWSGKYRCAENREGRYNIEFFGDVRLRVTQERSYRAGDRYDMAAGLIHSVDVVESEEVLSLVHCSEARSDHSWVYTRRDAQPTNFAPGSLLSRDLVQILNRTREALSKFVHL